ncbi:MAG: hypothetical protein ACRELG_18905 [Gemmataceae bacterium]
MGDYLFPHFLSDPQEYSQAESLWRERWDDLLRRVGQERLWETPWANTCFGNGTAARDGNPIFSAIFRQRKLALRVIQLEPSDNPREFYVWTDTFAEGSLESVNELVISCVLTPETLSAAVELMRQWISAEKISACPESPDGPVSANTSETLSLPALSDRSPRSST